MRRPVIVARCMAIVDTFEGESWMMKVLHDIDGLDFNRLKLGLLSQDSGEITGEVDLRHKRVVYLHPQH